MQERQIERWTLENTAEFDLEFLQCLREVLERLVAEGVAPEQQAAMQQEITDLDAIIAARQAS